MGVEAIVVGVLLGMVFAAALSCFLVTLILLKSNDFGNSQAGIEQYTGYDPIVVDKPDGNFPTKLKYF